MLRVNHKPLFALSCFFYKCFFQYSFLVYLFSREYMQTCKNVFTFIHSVTCLERIFFCGALIRGRDTKHFVTFIVVLDVLVGIPRALGHNCFEY